MTRPVLGLDIGGANLKAAHTSGAAKSVPFALWRDPGGLEAAIGRLVAEMPPFDALAVTMTGELCDCFASKREGVNHILDAVEGRAKAVKVWTNEGEFVDVPTARREALKVASANWLALATFAGRFAPTGPALLLDMGTTTIDIIPLLDGRPVPSERTDAMRLYTRELVYRGWKRTPACALGDPLVAAELFATMHDVCLLHPDLRRLFEDAQDRDTADGQPATREAARLRLARMMCADLETWTDNQIDCFAERLFGQFIYQITVGVKQVARAMPQVPQTAVLSGSGAPLLPYILTSSALTDPPAQVVRLEEELDAAVSAAACAYAVAVLAQEKEG